MIDNKAKKYLSMSLYTYAGNNPIAFMDPDGNELILSFATNTARKSYEDLVSASLGGKYSATYTKIEGISIDMMDVNMVPYKILIIQRIISGGKMDFKIGVLIPSSPLQNAEE